MKKILIVEPNDGVREMLCECLRVEMLEPVPCPSAATAPSLAATLPADAVVLALAGAIIEREPLYRALRDDPRTQNIPLILCTGHRNATLRRRLGERPPYVVFKPFETEQLMSTIHLALRESESPAR